MTPEMILNNAVASGAKAADGSLAFLSVVVKPGVYGEPAAAAAMAPTMADIREGMVVEVLREPGSPVVWYLATVLALKVETSSFDVKYGADDVLAEDTPLERVRLVNCPLKSASLASAC